MNTEDLLFNFGCASCGYKESNEKIDVRRILSKLDGYFDANDLVGAGKLLDTWRKEAERIGDLSGALTLVSEQMGYYRKTNEREKALEAVERGLYLIEKVGVCKQVSGATIMLNAATTLKAFGLAEESIAWFEKVKEIYEEKLAEDDRQFGGFWNNFALALFDVGRYAEAEEAYRRAIFIMEKTQNGKPDAAVSYINMAQLFGAMENKSGDDILEAYRRAKELLLSEENMRDGYYYFVLSKCAPAFYDIGEEEFSLELERQVRAFREGT